MKEEYKIFLINSRSTWEISNLGNVRVNGIVKDHLCDVKGYYRFCGKYPVHRAVAELFIDNPDNKKYVDHIDGNTHNNRVDNLRWVTATENNQNPHWIKKQKEAQINKKHKSIGPFSKEHKEKLKESHLGKKRTKEWCENHSKQMEGKNNPMYGRRKIWNENHTDYKWIKIY